MLLNERDVGYTSPASFAIPQKIDFSLASRLSGESNSATLPLSKTRILQQIRFSLIVVTVITSCTGFRFPNCKNHDFTMDDICQIFFPGQRISKYYDVISCHWFRHCFWPINKIYVTVSIMLKWQNFPSFLKQFREHCLRFNRFLLIAIYDGIESMCDGQYSTIFELCSDRLLNKIIRLQVHSSSSLIQYQDLSLSKKSSS